MNRIIVAVLCIQLNLVMGCAVKTIDVEQIDNLRSHAIIIDHTCTNIDQIPEQWIRKAQEQFAISYGHTSHGSQIVSGMQVLSYDDDLYSFSSNSYKNTLTIFDREPRGDLGNPNRTAWAERTRDLLDNGWGDANTIMWSWCGQVSNASEKDIDTYLQLMDRLEKDYSNIIFIYMTGHLDGSGVDGNLNRRNNQIRAFCRNNNKILYDFADIESYDPDGNGFLGLGANDRCDYRVGGNTRNWADEWCAQNPGECTEYRCAHSRSLNCDLKASAFWWMMARLAGWNPEQK